VAALPLPLQDFHLLAFASLAGRTHQYHALHMGRLDGIDVCRLFFIVSVRGNMSSGATIFGPEVLPLKKPKASAVSK